MYYQDRGQNKKGLNEGLLFLWYIEELKYIHKLHKYPFCLGVLPRPPLKEDPPRFKFCVIDDSGN